MGVSSLNRKPGRLTVRMNMTISSISVLHNQAVVSTASSVPGTTVDKLGDRPASASQRRRI